MRKCPRTHTTHTNRIRVLSQQDKITKKHKNMSSVLCIASLFSVESLLYKPHLFKWLLFLSHQLFRSSSLKEDIGHFSVWADFWLRWRCLFCFGPGASGKIANEAAAEGKRHVPDAALTGAVLCVTRVLLQLSTFSLRL